MYISSQSLNFVLTLTWLSLATASVVLAHSTDEVHSCVDCPANLPD